MTTFNLKVFDEPLLEFAEGYSAEHPRDGLTLFGPNESDGFRTPAKIQYGLIGTRHGISQWLEFVGTIHAPIWSEKNEVIWPHFPGVEEAFHVSYSERPSWVQELDSAELTRICNLGDAHSRVFKVVNQFFEPIKAAKQSDRPLSFIIVVVPDFVFESCRPLSRIKEPTGKPLSKRELAIRETQLGDFFGGYNPEQYSYSVDFRRQLKARSMEYDAVIQIVRESTLRLIEPKSIFGSRYLSPLSDRAWNLSTALYYKAGKRPWKLTGIREGVCYVGVSFKNSDHGNVCCAAQMFLDTGDGVVFMGDEGQWYSEKTGEYHLSKGSARGLLQGVLNAYRAQHGKDLTEIFLHCRSSINDDEYAGYLEACPQGAKLVAIRVAPERLGLRLYRPGSRVALRGTFWPINNRRAFLWCSGFKPRLRTYDGPEVPQPLCIDIQYGEADIEQVARDIFGLSKLNYNCCKLGESQPVTIHFSDAVGEILVNNKNIKKQRPNFKFYI